MATADVNMADIAAESPRAELARLRPEKEALERQLAAAKGGVFYGPVTEEMAEKIEWSKQSITELEALCNEQFSAYLHEDEEGIAAPTMDRPQLFCLRKFIDDKAAQDRADLEETTNKLIAARTVTAEAIGKRPVPKVQKPQVFTGKDADDVELWLESVELFLRLTRVDAAMWPDVATMSMRATALDTWIAEQKLMLSKALTVDWDAFCKVLRKYFGVRNPEHKARHDLDALKQTGSAERYTQAFNALDAKIRTDPIAMRDKVHLYVQGLHPKLAACVGVDPVSRAPWGDIMELQTYAINTWAVKKAEFLADTPSRKRSRPADILTSDPTKVVKGGKWSKGGPPAKKQRHDGPAPNDTIQKLAEQYKRTYDEAKRAYEAGQCLRCGGTRHVGGSCTADRVAVLPEPQAVPRRIAAPKANGKRG